MEPCDDGREFRLSRKVDHDLRAQMINITGLCGEIERSASELNTINCTEIIDSDSEVVRKLQGLINDDLLPCVHFLSISTSRLDGIISTLSASTTDNGEKDA